MTAPIRVIPWTSEHTPRITDLGPSARTRTVTEDLAWARAKAANPMLHDAPIFDVVRWDAHAGLIAVSRSSYALLVAGQPAITALGVTGILLRHTPQGLETLLGLRAPRTRIYPACWETAPRGTVPVPPGHASADILIDALGQESREELTGSTPTWRHAIALIVDPTACSLDVAFQGIVPDDSVFDPGSWEYDDVRWIPLPLARSWARGHTPPPPFHPDQRLSPPTAALLASGVL